MLLGSKLNISEDRVTSTCYIIFSGKIAHKIKQFTEAEAHRQHGLNPQTIIFPIMYGRGIYEAKDFPLN